jgi:hypothetical protein
MTPTAVSKVFADLDRHERMLQRALAWGQPGGLFETHGKVAGSKTVDLLTSDAAGMLAGVREHPAAEAFFKGAEPLMDPASRNGKNLRPNCCGRLVEGALRRTSALNTWRTVRSSTCSADRHGGPGT